MTTLECITALFCQVDTPMHDVPKHPHATLWPSEVLTLGLLHALKGGGNRAFYRWLTRDYRTLAAFHVLVQWSDFVPNASGFVPLSIAEFSL
jgi:hypothetical protein